MDKIFFAIIAMAFFFAGVHTFDHTYLSRAEPSVTSGSDVIQGTIKEGFKKKDETCTDTPQLVALGSSRWDVIGRATVTPIAEGWRYTIETTEEAQSLLAFCTSKKRAEGILALKPESTERVISITAVPLQVQDLIGCQ